MQNIGLLFHEEILRLHFKMKRKLQQKNSRKKLAFNTLNSSSACNTGDGSRRKKMIAAREDKTPVYEKKFIQIQKKVEANFSDLSQ